MKLNYALLIFLSYLNLLSPLFAIGNYSIIETESFNRKKHNYMQIVHTNYITGNQVDPDDSCISGYQRCRCWGAE